MVLTHQMKCVKPSAEGLFYPSTRARENPYYPIYVKNYVISQCEMTPASIGGGNKPVSVAGVNPPLRYTLREGCAGIRFGIMSADADTNPAPSLASET